MELISDIRSELVDEPSSHVSKAGTVDVQCPVPQLAALVLASRRDFVSFLQVFEDHPWQVGQGFDTSNWHVPVAHQQ